VTVAPGGFEPAFPGQRPPFTPGHEVTLKHGAYSPRRTHPLAAVIVERLLEDPDVVFLRSPAYRAQVWRYAHRQARADLLWAWIVDHGEECQGCEQCLGWEVRWREFDTAAGKASERLGLDPLSRARLGKDVAQGRAADAAAELTRMREEYERDRSEGVVSP
jgi:hypothetical protein